MSLKHFFTFMEIKFIVDKRRTEWGGAREMAKNRLLNTDPTTETERWTHGKPDSAHHSGLPGMSVLLSVHPSLPLLPHSNTKVVSLIRKALSPSQDKLVLG